VAKVGLSVGVHPRPAIPDLYEGGDVVSETCQESACQESAPDSGSRGSRPHQSLLKNESPPKKVLTRLLTSLTVAVVLGVGLLMAGLTPTTPAQAAASYNSEELAFVQLLNEYRASKGLPALQLSDSLSVAAERHASDMGKYGFFSHITQQSDWFPAGSTPWDRMAVCGYTSNWAAENIAGGQSSAAAVLSAWKGSSTHNANLLNAQARVVGIGFVAASGSPCGYYWVADLGDCVDPTAHDPEPVMSTRYEQGDSRLRYVGSWDVLSTSYASGGSYRRAGASGASVVITFDGTAMAWIAKTTSSYGKARVTVDGGIPATVDLYSPATKWRQKVWEVAGLAAGVHTVRIAWTGTRNPASSGTYINLDALDVTGVLLKTPVPKRYEQADSRLVYFGNWTPVTTSYASGGSFRYTNSQGAAVSLKFTGSYIAWIAKRSPAYGKAKLVLDGGAPVTVDLYNSYTQWRKKVWEADLPYGSHELCIQWTGTRNPSASNTYISVDAFDISGVLY